MKDSIKFIIFIINCILLFVITLASLLTIKYEKAFLKKEKSKELQLPLALWIVDKFNIAKKARERIKSNLANLQLYRNVFNVVRMHYCKKISLCIAIVIICNILSVADYLSSKDNKIDTIQEANRPKYGDTSDSLSLDVNIDGKSSRKVTFDIEPRTLSDNEREKLFKDVYKYIKDKLPAKNKNLNQVTKKLELVKEYPKDSNVNISWMLDSEGLIDESGYVENIDKKVSITLIITYLQYKKEYTINVTLKKHSKYDKDMLVNKIKKDIKRQNQDESTNEKISFPKEIDGVKIDYSKSEEETKNTSLIVLILGVVAIILILISKDKEIDTKMKERNDSLVMDYPKLLNKFALLLSAGFTIRKGWEKICYDACKEMNIQLDGEFRDSVYLETENNKYITRGGQKEANYVSYIEDFDSIDKDSRKKSILQTNITKQNKTSILQSKRKDLLGKNDTKKDKSYKKKNIVNITKKQKIKARKRKKDSNTKLKYVYGEMIYTLQEMYGGKSEVDAYEDFAKRVGLVQYTKLCSLFIQSIVSGVSNIVDILEIESIEAQKDKTECVKQCGKKIGTKMLLPMMGLLAITLVIVIIPILFSTF